MRKHPSAPPSRQPFRGRTSDLLGVWGRGGVGGQSVRPIVYRRTGGHREAVAVAGVAAWTVHPTESSPGRGADVLNKIKDKPCICWYYRQFLRCSFKRMEAMYQSPEETTPGTGLVADDDPGHATLPWQVSELLRDDLDFVPDDPAELRRAVTRMAAHINHADWRFIKLIAAMDRTRGWAGGGITGRGGMRTRTAGCNRSAGGTGVRSLRHGATPCRRARRGGGALPGERPRQARPALRGGAHHRPQRTRRADQRRRHPVPRRPRLGHRRGGRPPDRLRRGHHGVHPGLARQPAQLRAPPAHRPGAAAAGPEAP